MRKVNKYGFLLDFRIPYAAAYVFGQALGHEGGFRSKLRLAASFILVSSVASARNPFALSGIRG
jgi:hypothetical protein